ncbi:MAG: hypothetical protein ACREDY_05545 [Bradyrhizobium sp.]
MTRMTQGPRNKLGAPESQTRPSTPPRPAEKGTSRPQVNGPALECDEVPSRRTWNMESSKR